MKYLKNIILLFVFLNSFYGIAQCETVKSLFENDLYASKELRDYASKADDPDKVFDAWHLLLEEKSLEKTNAKVLKEVEDNYQAIKTAGGYVKWKTVNGAGSVRNTIKYVDNYSVTSTGKIAEIIGENGDVLGTLYKQKKYATSTKLEYSYKYKTASGNVKTFNKLEAEITDDFIEFEFNIPDELKGQGLGSTVLDDAIKYYDIKNPNYKGVRGRWEGADPQYVDGMSDNFKAFKDAKLTNKTDEVAAFETWTGKQAQKQGFTKAKVVTNSDNLVLVEFTK